jgi:hypothetical protein
MTNSSCGCRAFQGEKPGGFQFLGSNNDVDGRKMSGRQIKRTITTQAAEKPGAPVPAGIAKNKRKNGRKIDRVASSETLFISFKRRAASRLLPQAESAPALFPA